MHNTNLSALNRPFTTLAQTLLYSRSVSAGWSQIESVPGNAIRGLLGRRVAGKELSQLSGAQLPGGSEMGTLLTYLAYCLTRYLAIVGVFVLGCAVLVTWDHFCNKAMNMDKNVNCQGDR